MPKHEDICLIHCVHLIYMTCIAYFFKFIAPIMHVLAGTPPDWRYCQINSIIIDYREQLSGSCGSKNTGVCSSGGSYAGTNAIYPGVCVRVAFPGGCARALDILACVQEQDILASVQERDILTGVQLRDILAGVQLRDILAGVQVCVCWHGN